MKQALLIAAKAQPIIEDRPVIGEDQAFGGAHAVEQYAGRIRVSGDSTDDMVVSAAQNWQSFRQSGLGCRLLVDAAHHRTVANERREELRIDIELAQEIIGPLTALEVEGIGARGERVIGARLAGEPEGDPVSHIEPGTR